MSRARRMELDNVELRDKYSINIADLGFACDDIEVCEPATVYGDDLPF